MALWPNGSKSKPYVSSAFGPRNINVPNASKNHKGTDFSHTFSIIRAVEAGQVKVAGTPPGWAGGGTQVWVQHDGFFSKSLHASSLLVKAGQFVREGDPLAVMGRTGTASDVHLHLEITEGNVHYSNTGQVDPVKFIQNRLAGTSGGESSWEDIMAKLDEDDRKWLDAQFGKLREIIVAPGQNYGAGQAVLNEIQILSPLVKDTQNRVRGSNPRGDMLQLIREDLGKPITAEVDEAALAKELAPMLPAHVGAFSDADLSRIAKAAADESDRRERERLGS